MSDGVKQEKPAEPQIWQPKASDTPESAVPAESVSPASDTRQKEYGGRRDGLDPTRYGDWEKNGRCIDF